MTNIQRSKGCDGSPKLRFADLMPEEDQASDIPQTTAASRAVAAFLDNLEEEEAKQDEGAAKLGVNMVTISLADAQNPADEMIEIHSDAELDNSQQDLVTREVSDFFAEIDGGFVYYKPVEPNHAYENPSQSTAAVAAFFEDLDGEENSAGDVTSAATFAAICKIKRPEITEDSLPTMAQVQRGGYTECIICLKPLHVRLEEPRRQQAQRQDRGSTQCLAPRRRKMG